MATISEVLTEHPLNVAAAPALGDRKDRRQPHRHHPESGGLPVQEPGGAIRTLNSYRPTGRREFTGRMGQGGRGSRHHYTARGV